ncbi:hypothetical protein [Mesorhizobium sp. M2A.F.Ca.ET.042.01.1.1]|nr:hypothetical protein [Mesorhizobium sp. M2A.F.Ca.ET.042.01.1.1]
MHQLDEAGFAGAVSGLSIVCAFALVGQKDVEPGPEGQRLE